mgnify:CR=1 FL=1
MTKSMVIRFYEEAPEDTKAYAMLQNYREYGYDSMRRMIIASILNGERGKDIVDMDLLAEKIASKLSGKVIFGQEFEEEINIQDQSLDKALSFMALL